LARKILSLLKHIPFLYRACVFSSKKLGLYSFLKRLTSTNSVNLAGRISSDTAVSSERVEHIHAQLKKAHKQGREEL
jgi:hypothetical protein